MSTKPPQSTNLPALHHMLPSSSRLPDGQVSVYSHGGPPPAYLDSDNSSSSTEDEDEDYSGKPQDSLWNFGLKVFLWYFKNRFFNRKKFWLNS